MSSPTKIRHSFSCLFKIENKKKNKLSQMRQLVYSFWRRKSENRLQNVQINAFLHILLTKNEKSSTKRAHPGASLHVEWKNLTQMSTARMFHFVELNSFTQTLTAEAVSRFVSRKSENQWQKVEIRDHFNFLYNENRKNGDKKWNSPSGPHLRMWNSPSGPYLRREKEPLHTPRITRMTALESFLVH